jgi:hypothetical protein
MSFALAAVALASSAGIAAQPVQTVTEMGQSPSPYPEIIDLALRSPVVVDATIRSLTRITGPEAAMVPPGWHRYYVTVDITALVRGTAGSIQPRVGYVLDVPLDARGRPPRLRKTRVMLFARPVSGRPDQIQLVDLNAQQPWTPAVDAATRQAVREAIDPAAPPAITGISNVFHVPGSLPGEGETQIFLATETGAPVSLLVQRRPGMDRRWAVALSDIVDQAAGPPEPNTLLWYRLACGLPERLSTDRIAANSEPDTRSAIEDYALIRDALGPCPTRR